MGPKEIYGRGSENDKQKKSSKEILYENRNKYGIKIDPPEKRKLETDKIHDNEQKRSKISHNEKAERSPSSHFSNESELERIAMDYASDNELKRIREDYGSGDDEESPRKKLHTDSTVARNTSGEAAEKSTTRDNNSVMSFSEVDQLVGKLDSITEELKRLDPNLQLKNLESEDKRSYYTLLRIKIVKDSLKDYFLESNKNIKQEIIKSIEIVDRIFQYQFELEFSSPGAMKAFLDKFEKAKLNNPESWKNIQGNTRQLLEQGKNIQKQNKTSLGSSLSATNMKKVIEEVKQTRSAIENIKKDIVELSNSIGDIKKFNETVFDEATNNKIVSVLDNASDKVLTDPPEPSQLAHPIDQDEEGDNYGQPIKSDYKFDHPCMDRYNQIVTKTKQLLEDANKLAENLKDSEPLVGESIRNFIKVSMYGVNETRGLISVDIGAKKREEFIGSSLENLEKRNKYIEEKMQSYSNKDSSEEKRLVSGEQWSLAKIIGETKEEKQFMKLLKEKQSFHREPCEIMLEDIKQKQIKLSADNHQISEEQQEILNGFYNTYVEEILKINEQGYNDDSAFNARFALSDINGQLKI